MSSCRRGICSECRGLETLTMSHTRLSGFLIVLYHKHKNALSVSKYMMVGVAGES